MRVSQPNKRAGTDPPRATRGERRFRRVHAASFLIVVEAVAVAAIWPLRPPAPAGADAPDTGFSAARAYSIVREVARAPRPVGSAEHERVREWILARLAELGLDVRVEEPARVRSRDGGPLRNILARLPGRASTGTVLLATHYDSVPAGPGAGDAAAPVATLLETARALRAGEPLRNDVLLLFSDGEEEGLRGAAGLLDEHELLAGVEVVLNFEARGNSGPAILFETSAGNAPLISAALEVVAHPVTNSLAQDIYERMPNDTDFSVFKAFGLAGLNFAFIDGHSAYHTALDTPENLSLRSLQHLGGYALPLCRRFGDVTFPLEEGGDLVWFNAFGGWTVSYRKSWARAWAGAVLVLFLVLGLRRWKSHAEPRRRARRVVARAIEYSLASVLVLWLGLGALRLAGALPEAARGETARSLFLTLALWNVGFLCATMALRRAGPAERAVLCRCAQAPWAVLLVVAAVFFPGASFLATWPLLLSILAFVVGVDSREGRSVSRAVLSFVISAAALVLPASAAYLLLLAEGPVPALAIGVPLATALGAAGLVAGELDRAVAIAPRGVPRAFLGAAALCLVAACW